MEKFKFTWSHSQHPGAPSYLAKYPLCLHRACCPYSLMFLPCGMHTNSYLEEVY